MRGESPMCQATSEVRTISCRLTASRQASRSMIALCADGRAFVDWCRHPGRARGARPRLVAHALSWLLNVSDPDGNPVEITTCERDSAKEAGPC